MNCINLKNPANRWFHLQAAWLVGGFAILASTGLSLHAEEAALRWKFSAGQERQFRWTQSSALDIDQGDTGKVQTLAEQVIDFSWQVDKVLDDDSGVLVQQIQRIRLNVTGPNKQSARLDSASKKPPQGFGAMMGPLVRVLIDKPVTLSVSPRGQVRILDVDDSLMETILASPGKKIMGDLAPETVLKNLACWTSLPLPKTKTLQLDQQWTEVAELSQPLLGKLRLETTFAYKGPASLNNDRKLEQISLTLLATLENAPQAGETKLRIVDQKSSGEARFDREAGWIESSATEHTLSLLSSIEGDNTPVTLRQTTKLERLQADDQTDTVRSATSKGR